MENELTEEELVELERKHEAAMPGPWVRLRGSYLVVQRANMPQGHDGEHVAECEEEGDTLAEKPTRQRWKANAEAIAAEHNAFPALLSMARRAAKAEGEPAELRAELSRILESCNATVQPDEPFAAPEVAVYAMARSLGLNRRIADQLRAELDRVTKERDELKDKQSPACRHAHTAKLSDGRFCLDCRKNL